MVKTAITVRLDSDLEDQLDKVAGTSGRNRSEIIRDALRRYLTILEFESLRQRLMPFAEARGYLTDEDVFQDVS